jgi:hypothetical protein
MEIITQNLAFIILTTIGVLIIGFVIVGVKIFGLGKKIDVLFGGTENKETDIQRNLVERVTKAETKLLEIEPRLALVEAISKISVQKVGFMRFNPFGDTGGDNSFVLVLLDCENNGVMISSFYAREGVRVFAKHVDAGRTKQQLSGEERKVLQETINK